MAISLQRIVVSALILTSIVSVINLTGNQAAQAGTFPGTNGKIAFLSGRDGNGEIYTMDANGGSPTNLSNNGAHDGDPSWAPDGTMIAFESDRDANGEIYTMDANGGSLTRLTNNDDIDEEPSWSPDGSMIAFRSNRDINFEIYTMDANGGSLINLSNNPAFDSEPSWSPDGTMIAFVSNRDGNTEIYTMDANGGSLTRLTNNDDDDIMPDWGVQIASKTPSEATQDLKTLVDSMGLKKGIQNSLDAKLNSIINFLNIGDCADAKGQLNAFIQEVKAQTGKAITAAQATQLINAAQAIIASLPC